MSKISVIPNTVSVLEGGNGTTPEVFTVVRIPNQYRFNQSELAFIRDLVRMAADELNEAKGFLVSHREELWQLCDKDNPDTADAFAELNEIKTDLKRLNKHSKTVQSIFTKIKKQVKQS